MDRKVSLPPRRYQIYLENASLPSWEGASFDKAKEVARRLYSQDHGYAVRTVNVFLDVNGSPYLVGFVASWGEKWVRA